MGTQTRILGNYYINIKWLGVLFQENSSRLRWQKHRTFMDLDLWNKYHV